MPKQHQAIGTSQVTSVPKKPKSGHHDFEPTSESIRNRVKAWWILNITFNISSGEVLELMTRNIKCNHVRQVTVECWNETWNLPASAIRSKACRNTTMGGRAVSASSIQGF